MKEKCACAQHLLSFTPWTMGAGREQYNNQLMQRNNQLILTHSN